MDARPYHHGDLPETLLAATAEAIEEQGVAALSLRDVARRAGVQIATRLLFSDIRIDSTGGSNPIESHGHTKGDARRIRELIEQYQRPRPAAVLQ